MCKKLLICTAFIITTVFFVRQIDLKLRRDYYISLADKLLDSRNKIDFDEVNLLSETDGALLTGKVDMRQKDDIIRHIEDIGVGVVEKMPSDLYYNNALWKNYVTENEKKDEIGVFSVEYNKRKYRLVFITNKLDIDGKNKINLFIVPRER